MDIQRKKTNHLIIRSLLLCLGLIVMAFGVAFSIKAGLGTSPISSVPYVTSEISGLSVGCTTIIMNFIFVFIQIIILRSQYDWFQLFQLPAAVIFGLFIDIAETVLSPINCSAYWGQWLLCLVGIFLVALGISMEVTANLVTTAGEGIVLAVCKVTPIKFGNLKTAFDITLVAISVILGFLFLGRLCGVREGTIAAAVLVGQVTKQTNKLMKKAGNMLLT